MLSLHEYWDYQDAEFGTRYPILYFCGAVTENPQIYFCPWFLSSLWTAFVFCCVQTPLHLSVYLEQSNVVQELVLRGVNTALQDRNGNTPLHLACEQQSLECAQLLLLEPVFGKPLEPRRTLQNLQLQNWQGEKVQSLIRGCVHREYSCSNANDSLACLVV